MMGRIPQGVLTALRFDAELIVFGTGASKKVFQFDREERELLEAEYSLEYLKLHFEDLRFFKPITSWMEKNGVAEVAELRDRIVDRIVLDNESTNTFEEIENAGKIFFDNKIEQIFLVSSPTHVVRCLRDATSIFRPNSFLGTYCDRIYAAPSVTSYEGTSGKDVVVIEPPHRPGRHVVPTHRRIQRMLELQKLLPDDLVQLIDDFDDLLQRYEHKYHTENRKAK